MKYNSEHVSMFLLLSTFSTLSHWIGPLICMVGIINSIKVIPSGRQRDSTAVTHLPFMPEAMEVPIPEETGAEQGSSLSLSL